MTDSNKRMLAIQVRRLFEAQLDSKFDMILANVSTVDGFLIAQCQRDNGDDIEGDKVAAISSSLCSLANSASLTLLAQQQGTINIESESGKILFLNVKCGTFKAVMTVATNANMSLAEARFLAKRLKDGIEALE